MREGDGDRHMGFGGIVARLGAVRDTDLHMDEHRDDAFGNHAVQRRVEKRNSFVTAVLWIALGSALGGVGRYWCSGVVARRFGERFPWGTLTVNILGSFVIGLFAGLGPDGADTVGPTVRQFVMIGVCGGFTTFSSFSWQTHALARDGQWRDVWKNILLSTFSCLAAVAAGFFVALLFGSMEGR
jgi:fluoride exporter